MHKIKAQGTVYFLIYETVFMYLSLTFRKFPSNATVRCLDFHLDFHLVPDLDPDVDSDSGQMSGSRRLDPEAGIKSDLFTFASFEVQKQKLELKRPRKNNNNVGEKQ